jgi:hypothetical protein
MCRRCAPGLCTWYCVTHVPLGLSRCLNRQTSCSASTTPSLHVYCIWPQIPVALLCVAVWRGVRCVEAWICAHGPWKCRNFSARSMRPKGLWPWSAVLCIGVGVAAPSARSQRPEGYSGRGQLYWAFGYALLHLKIAYDAWRLPRRVGDSVSVIFVSVCSQHASLEAPDFLCRPSSRRFCYLEP